MSKIASYDTRIVIQLSTSDWVSIGRPDAIDVDLSVVPGKDQINVSIKKGTHHKAHAKSADRDVSVAFMTTLQRPVGVPLFGLTTVHSKPNGQSGKLIFEVPTNRVPLRKTQRKAKEVITSAVEGRPRVVPLEDAVYSINQHKKARPKEIVLAVDEDNFLDVRLSFGR